MRRWLLLAFALAGCTASDPELLANGGFEEDADWFWFESSSDWVAPFERTSPGRTGDHALRTHLVSEAGHGSTAIVGAIQQVNATGRDARIPSTLGGSYFVREWQSDADRTYVQAVVSFFPPDQPRSWCPGLDPRHPCQMAFILAGLDERPFAIANRIFVLPGDDRVVSGQWIDFEYDLRGLMAQTWGVERLDFKHLWFYLEARYETEGPRDVELDVLWDDVSMRK